MAGRNPQERRQQERQPGKAPRTQFVHAEGRVSLAQWLEVSWFYPEGFTREALIETARSLIVVGSSVVYKFIKEERTVAERGVPATFADRWRAACSEILLNRELAPDLYLGVRLLRWVDDEPHWITEYRSKALDPEAPPEDADEVAIVMRRLPDGARLFELIEEEQPLPARHLSGIVRQLGRFHRTRTRRGQQRFIQDPDRAIQEVGEGWIGALRLFMQVYGSFLDPFSRVSLQEVRTYIDAFIARHNELLYARGLEGRWIECHGRLDSRAISLMPLHESGREISIFGRRSAVYSDVLGDLASLAVDLEERGMFDLAQEIERQYFERNPETRHGELYRFLLVAASAQRAAELFRRGLDQHAARAARYLSLALRCTLGLRQPFIIAVGGAVGDGRRDVAKGVSELVSGTVIDAEAIRNTLPGYVPPDELLFERLLGNASQTIQQGFPVIIDWPLNRREERLKVRALAKKERVPYLLVKCRYSKEERVRRGRDLETSELRPQGERRLWAADSGSWEERTAASDRINQVLLEPTMSQPELSLYILRELVRACAGN